MRFDHTHDGRKGMLCRDIRYSPLIDGIIILCFIYCYYHVIKMGTSNTKLAWM